MTLHTYMSSVTQNATFASGGDGDIFYVATGVALTSLNGLFGVFQDEMGSATALIYGSVTAFGSAAAAIQFGTFNNNKSYKPFAVVQIGAAGSVISGDQYALDMEEPFAVTNAGQIAGLAWGVTALNQAGTIINTGSITGSRGAIEDTATSGASRIDNDGEISSAAGYGIYEANSHSVEIANRGAIHGGPGDFAIYSNPVTNTAPFSLVNYATGTISGGMSLGGAATVDNRGAVSGGTALASGSTLGNSGSMDGVTFTGTATGSLLVNYESGTIGGGVFLGDQAKLDNRGAVSGGTRLGSGSALVNSGSMDGVRFAGTAAGSSLVNSASGTISGGVTLGGTATIDNRGAVSGGTTLGGMTTLVNSGSMDEVDFIATASGSSLANSGLLTQNLKANGLNFTGTNTGTIDGVVRVTGDGAVFTNSGSMTQDLIATGAKSRAVNSGAIHGAVTSRARIGRTGVVTAPVGASALVVSAGGYDIHNRGDIIAAGGKSGLEVHGGGQLVNRGQIAGGLFGVSNDAAAGVVNDLYNYGAIDADGIAVSDIGGHTAVIDNYGSLTGGSGYAAVYADPSSVEYLFNAGTIDGAIILDAAGSSIVDTGTIEGTAQLLGGASRFVNHGLVSGDVDFAGTGNVYKGATGSVTGTIYGAGADGIYRGGVGDETFDMTDSGAAKVVGGAGDDTFRFAAAGLTRATTLAGGDGFDTLAFTTAGTVTANQLANVSGIEQITLAAGTDSIALTSALVASATNATLTVVCGTGNDTVSAAAVAGAANKVTVVAGTGVDRITAGGSDTFVYANAAQSTSTAYDTITGADWSLDKFDLSGWAITAIDPAVTAGSLSGATFNSDLVSALGASQFLAHSAALFTPTLGGLAGKSFLVVDHNGVAGYQAGADMVFAVTGAVGALTTGNFV